MRAALSFIVGFTLFVLAFRAFCLWLINFGRKLERYEQKTGKKAKW